ncbi:MAG: TonB-dependent receptor, partial [Bacteroidota bacterium]|nr:TonB-dependent receptor [Bacteroidota bacterium]
MKIILLLTLLVTGYIIPQNENGKITGRIIDEATQQTLPGVNVLIVGTKIGTVSDSDGSYEISGLSYGSYTLKISLVGYKTLLKADIFVNSTRPANIDFALTQSVLELEGVTVTSSFFQKDPHELNSVSSFSYEEIRRSPGGFEDVIRALSILPGVAQADAGRNDLIVRGGAPSENLYVLDGIVVPNINHFGTQGATGGPLSYIDLNYVNETSFSSGGFSVMYGDKLSSVLKIDLRNGRKDKIGGKLIISASQFGLNAEGPLGRNTDFALSARRSYLDLIFKAAGASFIPEYYDVLTKVNHNFDQNNSLSFLFISAFDNVKYINNTSDQKYDNSTVLGSNQTNYVTGLTYKHLFNSGFYTLTLSRNFNDYDTSQRDSLLNPLFLNKSKEGENSLKGDLVYRIGKNTELNFGAQIRYIKFDADIYFPPFVTSYRDTLKINSLKSKEKFYKAGFYTQYSSTYFNKFRFNAGVRADYFNGITNNFTIDPRLSFAFLISEITSLNFSTGIYHQTPSYIWLQANPINKQLKSIKTNQYVLGVDHLLNEDLQVRVEGFIKNYNDYPASLARTYLVLANTEAGFAGSEDNFAS